jgi:hypothetical protein
MSCGPRFTAMSVSNGGAIMGVNSLGIEYFSGNDGWPFLARTYVRWMGVGGRDPANIWAVGENGAVIRYDGSHWVGQDYPLPPGSDRHVYSTFGSSPSDIWGMSVDLKHFNGSGWISVDNSRANFRTGFARAPNDAIAVDDRGRPWHWDGTSWWQITLAIFGRDPIEDFWGTGPNDVWAVGGIFGSNGAIYHWDGDSWQRVYVTSAGDVDHVGGSAVDDVWFTIRRAENRTTVLHWDGSSFTELDTFDGNPLAIAATSPNDAWLMFEGVVHHYEGAGWNSQPINLGLTNVLGIRGAGVFFTSGFGHIYQSR